MISGFTYSSSCVSGYSESRNETRGHPFSKKNSSILSQEHELGNVQRFFPVFVHQEILIQNDPFL